MELFTDESEEKRMKIYNEMYNSQIDKLLATMMSVSVNLDDQNNLYQSFNTN